MNHYYGQIFDVLTMDGSYVQKVSGKALDKVYIYDSEASLKAILSDIVTYDVIDIHFLSPFYEIVSRELRKKSKKLTICIWGSDFYRTSENDKSLQLNLIKLADELTFGNPSTIEAFSDYFDVNESKLKFCPFGLSNLDHIDNLRQAELDDFLLKYDINSNDILVLCGHNASPAQQHELIIEQLKKHKSSFKNVRFMFAMTYGDSDGYKSKIEGQLRESGLNYLIFDKYMSNSEIAALRKCTEIFVQLQTTDQLSGSMQEHLYTDGIVITGSWLPYEILVNEGVVFWSIDCIDSLSSVLKDCIDNLDSYKKKCANNKMIISERASWKNTCKKWMSVYGITEPVNDNNEIRVAIKKNIETLINANYLKEANELIKEYRNLSIEDIEIYSMMGIINMMEGNFEEAFSYFEQGLKIDKFNFDLLHNSAYAMLYQSNYRKALFLFNEALKVCDTEISEEVMENIIEAKRLCNSIVIDKPLVTVGILNYNYERFLLESVNSVLQQTYENIEIIIIDDFSNDNSVNCIMSLEQEYDCIKSVLHDSNSGNPEKGIIELISMANGEYLLFLSADDLMFDDKSIALLVDEFIRDDSIDFVYGDLAIIDINGGQKDTWRYRQYDEKEIVFETFNRFGSGLIPITGGLHKVDFYKKNEITWYREVGNIVAGDTLNCLYNINYRWKVKYSPNTFISYRHHTNNMTYNLKDRIPSIISVLEYIINNFSPDVYLQNYHLDEFEDKECELCRRYFYISKHYFQMWLTYQSGFTPWNGAEAEYDKLYITEWVNPPIISKIVEYCKRSLELDNKFKAEILDMLEIVEQ